MGHVFDKADATAWERWSDKARNRAAMELECRLMLEMLKPMRRETVLEIGCGTGRALEPLVSAGLHVTGVDPSGPAIQMARSRLGTRVDFHNGTAESLPFDDNAFNYACIFKTLEFVDDPEKAIAEACRVAKYRVFIGALNPYSYKCCRMRAVGLFTRSVFGNARYFGIWELKRMARRIAGDVPVSWRTTVAMSSRDGRIARYCRQSRLLGKVPFGSFTAMTITMVPRFRVRPLELKSHRAPTTTTVAAGLVGTVRREKRWR